jgi:hypothetical protein
MPLLLNSGVFPEPNEFSHNPDVIGRFNETLDGSVRRDTIGITESFSLGYNVLSETDYDSLRSIFETSGAKLFEWQEMGIDEMEVHMDMNRRNVIPGTNKVSNVSLTLRRVSPQ